MHSTIFFWSLAKHKNKIALRQIVLRRFIDSTIVCPALFISKLYIIIVTCLGIYIKNQFLFLYIIK